MQLVQNPTTTSAAEAAIIRMQQEAGTALEALRAATVDAFRALWSDPSSRQEKLDIMGNGAVAAFQQHERTVLYLLASGIAIDPAVGSPGTELEFAL